MEGTTITTTCWVPRGFAARHPRRVEMDEEEFDRIAQMAKLQLDDAEEDLADQEAGDEGKAKEVENDKMDVEEETPTTTGGSGAAATAEPEKKEKEKDDDDLREYDLDNYDEPTAEEKETGESVGFLGNIKSLAYHQPGEEDPYITLKDVSIACSWRWELSHGGVRG